MSGVFSLRRPMYAVVAALLIHTILAATLRAETFAIDTSSLEPQVGNLVEAALAEIQTDQNDAEAWGHLGMVLHVHGLHQRAVESYARAARLNPNSDPQGYRWFYLAALASSTADQALKLFDQAYLLESNDYSLCIAYADALTREGLRQRASLVYRQAHDLAPNRGYADLGLARLAFLEGDLGQARSLLMNAREASPRNSEIYQLLAQVLRQLGETNAAVDSRWRANSYGRRLRPKSDVVAGMQTLAVSVDALQERGALLLEQGDLSAARNVFERVMSLQMSMGGANAETYGDLADVALAEGAYDQARDQYSRGLVLRPDNAVLMTGLARAYSGLADAINAEKWLQAALAMDVKYAPAALSLGQLRLRQRRYLPAIARLEAALALDPRLYIAYGDLGRAYQSTGDAARAYWACERLQQLDPDNVPNLRTLSRLQIERGDLAGAVGSLRRIRESEPQDSNAAFDFAMLLATTAEPESADAAEALQIALGLYRSNRHCARCADLLGVANAANEHFAEATKFARRALDLAGDDSDLAELVARHMAGYAERKRVRHPLVQ